jgi:hypothetical protein
MLPMRIPTAVEVALKLTYEHLQVLKVFRGLYPGPPLKKEGKGFMRK